MNKLAAIAILIIAASPCMAQEKPADWITTQQAPGPLPPAVVYHKTFKLDFEPDDAYLKFTCYTIPGSEGTRFRAFINNIAGASGSDWHDVQYMTLSKALHKGDNDLDIEVTRDEDAPLGPILVKLVASGKDKDEKPKSATLRSDSSWTYYRGSFSLASKVEGDRKPAEVSVTAPADSWQNAPNPKITPKVNTDTVVGVTDFPLSAGPAGSPSQFSYVNDYGDRFYLLRMFGCRTIEDRIYASGLYQQPADWSWGYDKQIAHSLDISGFRMAVAPWAWTPPEWYRKKAGLPMARCLQHGADSSSISLWSPQADDFAKSMYSEMKSAIGASISELHPGVYGDSGTAEFMCGHNDWTDPLPAHQHSGFWAGDDLARADFRKQMLSKYTSLENLNNAWKTAFKSPDEISYPTLDGTDTTRRKLDFIGWYCDSMTAHTLRTCSIARSQFPGVPIAPELSCGGGSLVNGQDATSIIAGLAKAGMGVRALYGSGEELGLRLISSACRFYGVPLEIRSSGSIDRTDRLAGIAGAGCTDLMQEPQQILETADLLSQDRSAMRGERSLTDVALFLPSTWQRIGLANDWPPRLKQAVGELRDYLEYDLLDERLISDGALDAYKVLVMMDSSVLEKAVYDKINSWIDGGGTLVICADELPLTTPEGSQLYSVSVPSDTDDTQIEQGQGRIFIWPGKWSDHSGYYKLISRAAGALDGKADGVWTSMFKNRLTFLNTTDSPVRLQGSLSPEDADRFRLSYAARYLDYSLTVPAHGMTYQSLDHPTGQLALECEDMTPGSPKEKNPVDYINRGGWGKMGRAVKLADGRVLRGEFQVSEPGSYSFACMGDAADGGSATLTVDGKKIGQVTGASGPHHFMYPVVGRIELKSGKHNVMLETSGQMLLDKVIITTDDGLTGFTYGFVDPQADQSW